MEETNEVTVVEEQPEFEITYEVEEDEAPSIAELGVVAGVVALAGYGAFKLGQKAVNFVKTKKAERAAKKAASKNEMADATIEVVK